jgi:hypothetical protein
MFSPKGSAAIAWDIDYNVYGISLKTGAKGAREIVASVFLKSEDGMQGFPDRLKKAFDELLPNPNSPIVVGGQIPGSILRMKHPGVTGTLEKMHPDACV